MTSLAIRAIPDGKQTTHESLRPLEGCFVLENFPFPWQATWIFLAFPGGMSNSLQKGNSGLSKKN